MLLGAVNGPHNTLLVAGLIIRDSLYLWQRQVAKLGSGEKRLFIFSTRFAEGKISKPRQIILHEEQKILFPKVATPNKLSQI